jgi:hypothetical protein
MLGGQMGAVARSGHIACLLRAARNAPQREATAALSKPTSDRLPGSSGVSAAPPQAIEVVPVNTHQAARVSPCMSARRWIGVLRPVAAAVALHASTALCINTPDAVPAPMPRGCPYSFLSDMPPGRFCAYRGAATGRDGAVCSSEAVVIWSAHGPLVQSDGGLLTTSERSVYFGFVDAPRLLVRGVADRPARARLVEYRATPDDDATELGGLTTLQRSRVGPPTLTMSTTTPLPFAGGEAACDLESYRGVFVGVIDLPCAACARD